MACNVSLQVHAKNPNGGCGSQNKPYGNKHNKTKKTIDPHKEV